MIKVIISGIGGRMGTVLRDAIDNNPDYSSFEVVAGFDQEDCVIDDIPVFSLSEADYNDIPAADVVIDFSNHVFIPRVLRFCTAMKTPVVIATTALDENELREVDETAKHTAVFRSANMSLGVNLVAKMSQLAAPVLEDSFNIEIAEAHHNKKKDSPSGTAILIADAINDSLKTRKEYIYGRHGREDMPDIGEIGIHAMRGGTIPGRHTVMFAGPDEVIEITHTVYSRMVFAIGALKAAAFVSEMPPGLYNMNDLMEQA